MLPACSHFVFFLFLPARIAKSQSKGGFVDVNWCDGKTESILVKHTVRCPRKTFYGQENGIRVKFRVGTIQIFFLSFLFFSFCFVFDFFCCFFFFCLL